jgi:hypothetical protein
VFVRVVERVVAVVANWAAVLKQAPCAVTVAAMVTLEHCENSAELDPRVTDAALQVCWLCWIELIVMVCTCANRM